MRILVTGMTSTAANAPGTRRRRYAVSTLGAVEALRSLGHTVDHRVVEPLEDLSGYDRAIVILHNCSLWGTVGLRWGAFWAAMKVRTVFAIDDWPVAGIMGSFGRFWWCSGAEDKAAMMEPYRAWIDALIADLPNRALLAGVYPWGTAGLQVPNRIVRWDPSRWIKCYPLEEPSRLRAWVNAHLALDGCESILQGAAWPVLNYSTKDGSYVPEAELVGRAYRRAWGVLARPYPHVGSGWWRARFQFAAEAGAVLLADPRECPLPAYQVTAREVEASSDDALDRLAECQRNQFWEAAQPPAEAAAVLEDALKAC